MVSLGVLALIFVITFAGKIDWIVETSGVERKRAAEVATQVSISWDSLAAFLTSVGCSRR